MLDTLALKEYNTLSPTKVIMMNDAPILGQDRNGLNIREGDQVLSEFTNSVVTIVAAGFTDCDGDVYASTECGRRVLLSNCSKIMKCTCNVCMGIITG